MDCLNQIYTIPFRLSGRVVMQRIANPSTPVRFRPQPPLNFIRYKMISLLKDNSINKYLQGIIVL